MAALCGWGPRGAAACRAEALVSQSVREAGRQVRSTKSKKQ